MTAAGSGLLGKLAGAVGPAPTVVGIALGGVVAGTVGSLTVGGRAATRPATGDPLPRFACPDWVTHPWVIANTQGRCYRLVVVGSERESVTLTPQDVPA